MNPELSLVHRITESERATLYQPQLKQWLRMGFSYRLAEYISSFLQLTEKRVPVSYCAHTTYDLEYRASIFVFETEDQILEYAEELKRKREENGTSKTN